MPTIEDRIATAKARAAAYKKRLEEHSLNAKLQEAEAKAEKLETDRAKQVADQKRRDDNHAKIILGAAVLLLSPAHFFQVIIGLIAVLTARDRDWIRKWCAGRNISLDHAQAAPELAPEPKSINVPESNRKEPEVDGIEVASRTALSADQQFLQSPVPKSVPEATRVLSSGNPKSPEEMSYQDTVGEALKRAISGLHEGDISMFSPEILKNANEDDRKVLEAWFASLAQRRAPTAEGMKSPDAEERVPAPEPAQLQDAEDCVAAGEGAESSGSHPQ